MASMMMMSISPWKLSSLRTMPLPPSTTSRFPKLAQCSPIKQEPEVDSSSAAILCEPCNGKGWLLCDFCKGQKTNVKSDSNRTYRRCPTCRAIGYVLCSKCKVFKCVTFPNYNDGEELSF
ncbi:putative Heat shock protein DnaJ, cysteine-rich [Rosa chinensis]|uniref:Putative Heat shock protein DnaJ, cysteine-rich n=1 Tax=Rosa chinensis TaxID=74649 RepID=A0A2P6PZV0_ROSCH|nr:putative Heat shock protein DnaJ, cysteine-rich [Rosa chinensis]